VSENEKLVIPAGVQFDLSGDGVSIEYAGDILLQGEHLKPVGRVISTEGSVQIQGSMKVGHIESQRGSVSITGDITVGTITASANVVLDGQIRFGSINASGIEVIEGSVEGTLLQASENIELRGTIDVANIRAPKISVQTGSLTAKALESTESITLGSASLQIDVVIAPDVRVDPETTGRVAVIESQNDLGPNGIRGAFNLKEFAQFTGQNPELFLSERGVGKELVAVDHFEEESETTQVSVPVASPATFEPEPEPEPAPEPEPEPVQATYEPEPTPVSTIQEPAEPVIESSATGAEIETEDDEIPAWNAAPEQEEASEQADDDIPAWDAASEKEDATEQADDDIPAWNAASEKEDATEQADDDIPAWNAASEKEDEDQSQQESMQPHGGISADEQPETPAPTPDARPEPIRVAVEMTDEPEAAAPQKKPLPPIAAPRATKPKVSSGGTISPIHKELIGTVNGLVTCYDGKEVPPAITELQSLIDAADFSKVRAEITNIWNNLLKHHQRTGTRLQHQVTTTFNTVNTLVRKID
jgi:hypothetical protein